MSTCPFRRRPFAVIATAVLMTGCDAPATTATASEPTQQTEAALGRSRQEVAVQSRKIVAGGGLTLSIYDAGAPGARPIVFIHGFGQNVMTWDRQLGGSLAESSHLIAYDLRGHGASEKPLDAASYTTSSLWADDLDAVIRAHDLERPVLVGWSYGGYVIADYLRKYGDAALGGLVFEGVTTKNGTPDAAAFLTDDVLAIFGGVLSPDVRASINASQALAALFARDRSDEWEIAFGSAMMVPPEVRLAMFSRLLDNDDVLAGIGVPTLVVHGREDRVVKLSAAQHTASMVPGARLLVYPGVGHAPHLEIPHRFNRDLEEFVRSIR
jgi:non-heme chloroperoxidase